METNPVSDETNIPGVEDFPTPPHLEEHIRNREKRQLHKSNLSRLDRVAGFILNITDKANTAKKIAKNFLSK